MAAVRLSDCEAPMELTLRSLLVIAFALLLGSRQKKGDSLSLLV